MAIGMTALALTLAGVGTGVSAFGQWRAGGAAKRAGEAGRRAAESQAELHDYNAAIAELQAADAIERGEEAASQFRQRVRQAIGSQRAGIAAQGVDVTYGSAVDAQADAEFLGELDALTIRTNAAREAWGFKVQSEDSRRRAEITRREGVMIEEAGNQQRTAARIGAVGSIIGGGASLLEARYGFRDRRTA